MSEMRHADPTSDKLVLDEQAPRLMGIGAVLGTAGLGLTAWLGMGAEDGGKQFFHSYLLGLIYFLSISLGALFFVTLQHLTRAGWSVVVRRVAEILAANLPMLVVLFAPILVGMWQGNPALYHWVDDNVVQHDELLRGKAPFLNVPFYLIRFGIYLVVWSVLSRFFLKQSVKQDESGDIGISAQMQFVSAPAMALFALTLSFAAYDTLMSIEAHWFSTIFGVYFFAGSVMSFLATTIVICKLLQASGILSNTLTVEHYHDLGKLLFGFVFFWGYIAFSQFMLIWYGNMPEETEWFLERQTDNWAWVSLTLLFGHFLLPFPGLLSRHIKRNGVTLTMWAVWLLCMHWVDMYWLIMPSLREGEPPLGLIDLTAWLGVGGLYLANFAYTAKGKRLLPVRDPRLSESLAFENL